MSSDEYTYQSPRGRMRVALIAVGAQVLFVLVATVGDVIGTLSIPTWNDLDAPLTGHPLEMPLLGIITLSHLGGLAAFIVAAVTVCMWMYRANANARALGARGMAITPGWAVGWWFIPFANLLMPFRAMKEIYLVTEQTAWEGDVKASSTPSIIGAWWTFWLLSGVTGQGRHANDDVGRDGPGGSRCLAQHGGRWPLSILRRHALSHHDTSHSVAGATGNEPRRSESAGMRALRVRPARYPGARLS